MTPQGGMATAESSRRRRPGLDTAGPASAPPAAAASSTGSVRGNGAGDDWRSLQDSPAGRLLTALYGKSTPAIDYSVLLPRRSTAPTVPKHDKPFIPGGGKPDVDVRAGVRKQANVPVPRFGKQRMRTPPARACFLPRRKSAAAIEYELHEINFQREHYRPPVTHAVSTDKEKNRLNEVFTHKGGKALPDELLHPVGPTPTELAETRRREKEQRRKRIEAGLELPPQPVKQPDLFDVVAGEIEERAHHLSEMAELSVGGGVRPELLARTKGEISTRMRELEKIDKQRFQQFVRETGLGQTGE